MKITFAFVFVFVFAFLLANIVHANEIKSFELKIHKKIIVTASDVAEAKLIDGASPPWTLELKLKPLGAKRLTRATRQNLDQPMDVVINGKVISSPKIKKEIKSDHLSISLKTSKEEAAEIADSLTQMP
jgi:preprotein translocase subunit SecD